MAHALRLRFDWQIVPFLLSALIGLTIAHDTEAARITLALIALGLGLYLFFANKAEPARDRRSGLRSTLALIPSVTALFFLLANDWSRSIDKLPILGILQQGLAIIRIAPGALQVNPNVIGGVIAAFLPLQIEALRGSRRAAQVVLIGLSLFGLILSATRGAWLALMVATGMWLLWRLLNRRVSSKRAARGAWMTAVMIFGALGLFILAATPLGDRLLGLSGQRPDIWRNSLALIGDYPVTGLGLGGFELVYSTYVLLVHVGHTMHAHNLWLDIWLQQGLLGMVAFAGMVLNAIWPTSNASHWRPAALMTVAVMLLHGLLDDPFYGYGGVAIPLVFIPLALLIRPSAREDAVPMQRSGAASRKFQPTLVVWSVALAAMLFSIITPNGRSVLHANSGVVLQTRAELSIYRWPQYGLQDVLRQSGAADLREAINQYEAALALDPFNVSANRRLGQIKLAQGQVQIACEHLSKAYAIAPLQRATNQLLGECYALRGAIDQAVQLWRTIDMTEGQLTAREWWYGSYLTAPDEAARLRQAATALKGD